jgi:predicted enzyme related to lactoylglutathione lyase
MTLTDSTSRSESRVAIRPTHLVIDCVDLDATAAFWSGLLDLRETGREKGWIDLGTVSPSGPVLAFQQVPEMKAGKNRLHLDLEVSDFTGAVHHARSLGGQPASPVYGGTCPWQVWQDPEGNEFCLISA